MSKTTLSLSIGEGAARLQGADATLRNAEKVLTHITRNLILTMSIQLSHDQCVEPQPSEPSGNEAGMEARAPGPPSLLACGRRSLWGRACEATLRRTLCLMLPASIREDTIEDVLLCMGCSNPDEGAVEGLEAAPPWLQHARALAGPLEGPGITEDDTVWGSAALANIWESPGWIEDVVLPAIGDLRQEPHASSSEGGRPGKHSQQEQQPTAESLRSSVAGLRAVDAAARLPWSEGRLDPEALRSGIEVVRGLVWDLEALDPEGAAAFRSGVRPPLSPPRSAPPSPSQKAYDLPGGSPGSAPSSLLVLSGESMCRVFVQLALMLSEERLVPCVRREAEGGELPAPEVLLTRPEVREEARKQSGLTAAASAAAGVGGTALVVLPPAPVSIGDLTSTVEYCSRAVVARPGSVRSTPLLRKLRRALLDARGRGPNGVLPTCREALGLFGSSRASAVTPQWAAELLGALRRLIEAFSGHDRGCRGAAEAIGLWERKLGSVFRPDAVALSVEWGATWSVSLPAAPSSSGTAGTARRQPYPGPGPGKQTRSSFDVSELSGSGPTALRGSSQRHPGEAARATSSRHQAPLWPVQERSISSGRRSSRG